MDYATSNGSALAGGDYTATSGTLTFQTGEASGTVEVAVLDDQHDEGEETLTLTLSNPSGAVMADDEATGTIENADLMPATLLARFGRATAEQVVSHIEERMAAPRRQGFRARFAGRDIEPGSKRDFARGLLSQFAQPTDMGRAGAGPMGGVAMGAAPMGGGPAMAGQGPVAGGHGGGLFGSMLGDDPLANSEFELNRESRGGILAVWPRRGQQRVGGPGHHRVVGRAASCARFERRQSRGPRRPPGGPPRRAKADSGRRPGGNARDREHQADEVRLTPKLMLREDVLEVPTDGVLGTTQLDGNLGDGRAAGETNRYGSLGGSQSELRRHHVDVRIRLAGRIDEQDESAETAVGEAGQTAGDRGDVNEEPARLQRASNSDRGGRGRTRRAQEGAPKKPLQAGLLRRVDRVQRAVAVGEAARAAQQTEGSIVDPDDAAGRSKVDDAEPGDVEQRGEGASQSAGLMKSVPNEQALAQRNQQLPHDAGAGSSPAGSVDGVAEDPDHPLAAGGVETDVQPALRRREPQSLVVGRRDAPLLVGVELGHGNEASVGHPPQARKTFVARPVVLEIQPLEVHVTLPAEAVLREMDLLAGVRARLRKNDAVTPDAAGGVEQRGSFRPSGRTESNLVQGNENPVIGIRRNHGCDSSE